MTLILRRAFFAAFIIALIVVVRLFPDQNQGIVDIDLLLTSIKGVHLWAALATTFAAGAAFAFFVSTVFLIKAGLVGRRYREAIANLEAEVHHLRNLPLAAGDLHDEIDSVAGNYASPENASHATHAKGS